MSFSGWRVIGIPCAVWAMLSLGAVACKRPSATSQPSLWLGPVSVVATAGAGDDFSLVDREALAQKSRSQLLQAEIFDGEAMQSTRPGAAVARIRITLFTEIIFCHF